MKLDLGSTFVTHFKTFATFWVWLPIRKDKGLDVFFLLKWGIPDTFLAMFMLLRFFRKQKKSSSNAQPQIWVPSNLCGKQFIETTDIHSSVQCHFLYLWLRSWNCLKSRLQVEEGSWKRKLQVEEGSSMMRIFEWGDVVK